MARLYANENFPLPVVIELRRLGHDLVPVRETGKANRVAPDVEILEFARAEKRAVLTLNRKHFIALHGLMPDHAGIAWYVRSPPISPVRCAGSTMHWLCMPALQGSSCE
jgi:hypothetical protein